MIEDNRVFSFFNPDTSSTEWYFQAREGDSGPYQSREEAEAMLAEFKADCVAAGKNGGRTNGQPPRAAIDFKTRPKFKFSHQNERALSE